MKQKIKNLIQLLEMIQHQFTGITDSSIDLDQQKFLADAQRLQIKLEQLLEGMQ